MTAVAPPQLQPISRGGWHSGSDVPNGIGSMASDDVGRMFMPRKSAQRSNSSSSLSSQASTASTVVTTSEQFPNGPANGQANGQVNGNAAAAADTAWAQRKKPARSLWPPPKSEPVTGLSGVRPQSAPPPSSGPSSAPSSLPTLHTSNSMLPSQHGVISQVQQDGVVRQQGPQEPQPILHLLPMNGTFERKTISVPYYPDVVRIGRQTNAKTLPTPINGYFDSKVLSRQHAEVWADRNGKIWIRDIKSSNGTFVNGQRLSQENRDSDPHELRESDMLELGIDIVSEDQKTVVHHKVAARVDHAGIYANAPSFMDMSLNDLDPNASTGLMAPPMQGMGQLRPRTGSVPSLMGNGRLANANGIVANALPMSQQRSMNFWLTPVTMEQIVKRLNTELRQAKQQSFELTRTTQFMDSILNKDPKEDVIHRSRSRASPIREGMQPRFPDPPAPPPQHPLPEKPDAIRASVDASGRQLARSDTERPKLVSHNTVPIQTDTSHQITSLVDALTAAKKEVASQSLRVRDLEDRLEEEQQRRETAENRAHRLEIEQLATIDSPLLPRGLLELPGSTASGKSGDESSRSLTNRTGDSYLLQSSDDGAMANRLQQRLELMVKEMEEMRRQMDQYRHRAETAEEASASDRRSLAEMVDKIRRDQKERGSAEAKKRGGARRGRSRSTSAGEDLTADPMQTPHIPDSRDITADGHTLGNGHIKASPKKSSQHIGDLRNMTIGQVQESAVAWLRNQGVSPGQPVSAEQVASLERMVQKALGAQDFANSNGKARGDRQAENRGALARLTATDLNAINSAAPFASMLGVVIVGVGLMAWLNGWQSVER